MWEDVTVALACLGFTAALVVIVAELRGLITQVEDAVHRRRRHSRTIGAVGRDPLLSYGAAPHHPVGALACASRSTRVERSPDPADSDHLAPARRWSLR